MFSNVKAISHKHTEPKEQPREELGACTGEILKLKHHKMFEKNSTSAHILSGTQTTPPNPFGCHSN